MPSPKRENYNNNKAFENARANYNRKGKRSASKPLPHTLEGNIGHMNRLLNTMNLANLYRLRLTSKAMRNKINASGVIQRKIPAAQRAEVQKRALKRANDPMFKYINAYQWRNQMFPENRIGLHPTVGVNSRTMTHHRMGQHIRNFAGRTTRGVLSKKSKHTYGVWALEHNQGRPYVPNNRNKQAVARALLAAFRKRKAARR
jgi:hypothetical protein